MISDPARRIENLKPKQLKQVLELYVRKYGLNLLDESGILEADPDKAYTSIKVALSTMDKAKYCCAKDRIQSTGFLVNYLLDTYMQAQGYNLDGPDK